MPQNLLNKKVIEDSAREQSTVLPPQSKDSKGNKIARYVSLGVGAGMDWDSTSRALDTGRAKEGNGLIAGAADSRLKLALVKGAGNVAAGLGLDHVAKKHPKLALATALGLGALQAGVGIRNYNIYNKIKK